MQTKIPVINEENIQEYLLYWSAQSLILLLSKSWNISCRAVYETRTYGSMGRGEIIILPLPYYPKFNSNKERKRCSFAVMHIFCTFVGKSGWLVMIYSLVRFQFILIHRS